MIQENDKCTPPIDEIEKLWLTDNGVDTTARYDWRHSWTMVAETDSLVEETMAFYVQANINAEDFGRDRRYDVHQPQDRF